MTSNNQGQKAAAIYNNAVQKLSGVLTYANVDRETQELPNILWAGELPEMLSHGTYKGRKGLLVATDKRVIFVDKGVFGALTICDFAYGKISSAESRTGIANGELTLNFPGHIFGKREQIVSVPNNQLRPFADLVRTKVSLAHGQIRQSAPVLLASVADELEKFAKLRD